MQNFGRYVSVLKNQKLFEIKRFFSSDTIKTFNDIPRPRSLIPLGTKLEFIMSGGGHRLHEYAHKRHQELGPTFIDKLNNSEIVFISNPHTIRQLFQHEGKYPVHILPEPWVLYQEMYGYKRGLFFMDGEEWLTNRRVVNKFLLREGAEEWIQSTIEDVITELVSKWKLKCEKGQMAPDLESEFYKLSIDVILTLLKGKSDGYVHSQNYNELIDMFSEVVKQIFQTTTKLYTMPVKWVYRLNLKSWRDFRESVDKSLLLAQKIVEEMLVMDGPKDGLIAKLKEENMSQDLITRIVADFIIAAGDTTAYTLLWTLYLLAKNGEVIQEIRTKDANYTKCVLKESMRLYPVAPFLTRILTNEAVLENYRIPKGTPIVASIYTSGRDERNFTKAEEFLPYRWDRNDERRAGFENFEPSASLPFAMGVRSCAGQKIATVQLNEVIKQMVDNFDFVCTNKSEVNAITSQVLIPEKPINLLFSLRKPA